MAEIGEAWTLADLVGLVSRKDIPSLTYQLGELIGTLQARLQEHDPEKLDQELVNSAEIARRFSMTKHWVRVAARQGKIPSVKVGRYVRFDPKEVGPRIRRLREGK